MYHNVKPRDPSNPKPETPAPVADSLTSVPATIALVRVLGTDGLLPKRGRTDQSPTVVALTAGPLTLIGSRVPCSVRVPGLPADGLLQLDLLGEDAAGEVDRSCFLGRAEVWLNVLAPRQVHDLSFELGKRSARSHVAGTVTLAVWHCQGMPPPLPALEGAATARSPPTMTQAMVKDLIAAVVGATEPFSAASAGSHIPRNGVQAGDGAGGDGSNGQGCNCGGGVGASLVQELETLQWWHLLDLSVGLYAELKLAASEAPITAASWGMSNVPTSWDHRNSVLRAGAEAMAHAAGRACAAAEAEGTPQRRERLAQACHGVARAHARALELAPRFADWAALRALAMAVASGSWVVAPAEQLQCLVELATPRVGSVTGGAPATDVGMPTADGVGEPGRLEHGRLVESSDAAEWHALRLAVIEAVARQWLGIACTPIAAPARGSGNGSGGGGLAAHASGAELLVSLLLQARNDVRRALASATRSSGADLVIDDDEEDEGDAEDGEWTEDEEGEEEDEGHRARWTDDEDQGPALSLNTARRGAAHGLGGEGRAVRGREATPAIVEEEVPADVAEGTAEAEEVMEQEALPGLQRHGRMDGGRGGQSGHTLAVRTEERARARRAARARDVLATAANGSAGTEWEGDPVREDGRWRAIARSAFVRGLPREVLRAHEVCAVAAGTEFQSALLAAAEDVNRVPQARGLCARLALALCIEHRDVFRRELRSHLGWARAVSAKVPGADSAVAGVEEVAITPQVLEALSLEEAEPGLTAPAAGGLTARSVGVQGLAGLAVLCEAAARVDGMTLRAARSAGARPQPAIAPEAAAWIAPHVQGWLEHAGSSLSEWARASATADGGWEPPVAGTPVAACCVDVCAAVQEVADALLKLPAELIHGQAVVLVFACTCGALGELGHAASARAGAHVAGMQDAALAVLRERQKALGPLRAIGSSLERASSFARVRIRRAAAAAQEGAQGGGDGVLPRTAGGSVRGGSACSTSAGGVGDTAAAEEVRGVEFSQLSGRVTALPPQAAVEWCQGVADATAPRLRSLAVMLFSCEQVAMALDAFVDDRLPGAASGDADAGRDDDLRAGAPRRAHFHRPGHALLSPSSSPAVSLRQLSTIAQSITRTGSARAWGADLPDTADEDGTGAASSELTEAHIAQLASMHKKPAQARLREGSAATVAAVAQTVAAPATPLVRAALTTGADAERTALLRQLSACLFTNLAELAEVLGVDGAGGACLSRLLRASWKRLADEACGAAVDVGAAEVHAGSVASRLDDALALLADQMHGRGDGLSMDEIERTLESTRRRVMGSAPRHEPRLGGTSARLRIGAMAGWRDRHSQPSQDETNKSSEGR